MVPYLEPDAHRPETPLGSIYPRSWAHDVSWEYSPLVERHL
jgi:hypothetical protein